MNMKNDIFTNKILIKIIMQYYCIAIRIAKMKKWKISTAGKNADWPNIHTLVQLTFFENCFIVPTEHMYILWHSDSTPRYKAKTSMSISSPKDMQKTVNAGFFVTADVHKQKNTNCAPFLLGAQCAMAANSCLIGSVHSLLLVWVGLRNLRDSPFQCTFMSLIPAVPHLGLGEVLRKVSLESPQGTVARVHSGQVIMSIHTNLQNKEHATKAPRRAKFKVPGCPKIHISKWGFTKFNVDKFEDMEAEKWLIPDGCKVKYIPKCGPWTSGEHYIQEGVHCNVPLLMLTNKSYSLSKKRTNLTIYNYMKRVNLIILYWTKV